MGLLVSKQLNRWEKKCIEYTSLGSSVQHILSINQYVFQGEGRTWVSRDECIE